MIDRQAVRNGLWGTRQPTVLFTGIVAIATLAMALSRATHAIADARLGGNNFQDDAFYYLVIARNLVLHGLLSFDGVHVTNGFHPLWMGIVILLQLLLGPDATPTQQVLAVTWVEQTLYVAAVACAGLFALRAARESSPYAAGFLALALMLASPLSWVFRQGMETTLAMLILLVVLQLLVARAWLAVGVALGLLVLTRLDTVVFVAAPLLLFVWTQQQGLRSRLFAALPVVAVVLADVLANIALLGHAVPISGALRSSFPWPSWESGFLMEPLILARQYGWWGLLITYNLPLVLAVLAVGLATMLLLPRERRAPATVWAIWASAALLTANLMFFQRWEKSTDPRYFALPMLAALFAALTALAMAARFPAVALGQRLPGRSGRGALFGRSGKGALFEGAAANVLVLGFVVALLLAGEVARRAAAVRPGKDSLTALMQDVDRTLPPDAVIAGTTSARWPSGRAAVSSISMAW